MNEIKQTLTILKNRWREVTLLIGLWALHRLITLTIRIYPDFQGLIQIVSISLSILTLIVLIGFLRTVYLQQDERQSLGDLIRTGKPFFWRFLILALLGGLAMAFFFGLLPRIIGTEGTVSHHITGPFMKLLLAKLFLLLPAIVIVTDCSISQSFNLMWKIRLLQAQAKPLLISFLAYIVLPTLLVFLFPDFWRAGTSITWATAIGVLYSIFLHIMNLMVSVMAIRFVSSLEITHSQPIKLDL